MIRATLVTFLATVSCVYGATIFSCNFETDFCGLIQLTNDNFDWDRGQITTSSNTGPTADASGDGYFAFMEGTDKEPESFGDLALPQLSGSTSYCLRFQYHMYGSHIGQLEVRNNNDDVIFLREKVGNNGEDLWIAAAVDFESTDIVIKFRAVHGGAANTEPFADIAIDEIRVEDRRCDGTVDTTESAPTTTTSPTTTSPTTTLSSTTESSTTSAASTDMSSPVTEPSVPTDSSTATSSISTSSSTATSPTSTTTTSPTTTTTTMPPTTQTTAELILLCSFSADDTCEVIQPSSNDFDWQITQAPSGSGADPQTDATNNANGHFFLAQTSLQGTENTATAIKSLSGQLEENERACVRFYYYMSAEDSAELHFYVVWATGSTTIKIVPAAEPGIWHAFSVDVIGELHQIQFMTTTNATAGNGNIAIDEVALYKGYCDGSVEPTQSANKDSSEDDELWGLEQMYWIIILVLAAALLFLFLIIICCVVCAYNRKKNIMKNNRASGNFDSVNNGKPNGSQASPVGYINAYENGTFQENP